MHGLYGKANVSTITLLNFGKKLYWSSNVEIRLNYNSDASKTHQESGLWFQTYLTWFKVVVRK